MKPNKIIGPADQHLDPGIHVPSRGIGGEHFNMVLSLADQTGQPYYIRHGSSAYYVVAFFDSGAALHLRDDDRAGRGQAEFVFSPSSRSGELSWGASRRQSPLEILAVMLDYFRGNK